MYAYSYTVNYGKWSSNTSAMHPDKYRLFQSTDEAKEFGDKEAMRLMTEGSGNVKSVEIEKFCVSCDGRGHNIVKSGKRVIRRKEVTCQDCKGYGTEIVISEPYNKV